MLRQPAYLHQDVTMSNSSNYIIPSLQCRLNLHCRYRWSHSRELYNRPQDLTTPDTKVWDLMLLHLWNKTTFHHHLHNMSEPQCSRESILISQGQLEEELLGHAPLSRLFCKTAWLRAYASYKILACPPLYPVSFFMSLFLSIVNFLRKGVVWPIIPSQSSALGIFLYKGKYVNAPDEWSFFEKK